MIKGVNKQVIEISDTQNIYYEKAWLVVKPQYAEVQRLLLEQEARKMLKSLDSPSAMKPKRSAKLFFLPVLISLLSGAGISTLVHLIFF